MADEAKTVLRIDPGPALAALDQVRAAVDGMQAEYRDLNKAGAGLFDKAGDSTADFVQDVNELAGTMGKAQTAMQNLVRYEKFLEAQQKRTTDPVLIKRYADEIARTRRAMSELRDAGVDTWQSIGREQQKGISIFSKMRGVVAGALPVLSLSAVAVGAVRAASAYESTRVSFETFLKSAEKADDLLGRLSRFAAKTPFSEEQINAAAKSLLAFGESEQTVIEKLEQIGNISAATGKDVGELTTIYGKARTAGQLFAEDINQLIEAGIPILDEFSTILGKQPGEIKKLASEGKISFAVLERAFQNLTSEGGRFSGQLEKQSETAKGLGSTLVSVFNKRLIESASGLLSLVKGIARGFIDLLDSTQKESDALEDQRIRFLALSNEIRLTNEDTQKRSDLIGDLQKQYPEFLGNVDKEKITNEQLQPILDKINKTYLVRIALQRQQEKLQPFLEKAARADERLAETRARFNQQLAKSADLAGVNLSQFSTLEEQVAAVRAQLEKRAEFTILSTGKTPLNEEARALQGIIEFQRQIGTEQRFQEIRADKLTEAEQARQRVVEELRNIYGEVFDIATKTNNQAAAGSPGATTGGGPTAEQIKQAADLERKRQELRLAVLQDGRAKEIALEQSRFEALTADLKKYFKGREDLNALLEQAETAHRENVQQINDRFDAEELARLLKLDTDRQALRLSLIEDGTQKELAAEKARFETLRAELEKQFKGTAELPGLLEKARAQHLENLDRINSAGLTQISESEQALNEQELALLQAQNEKVILLMRQRGASEKDIAEVQRQFDLLTQQKRLEAEIKFQRALLLATAGGDEERRKAIEAQIALLNQQLENVQIEINTPTVKGGPAIDLKKLLGLSDEDAQAIQQAANQIIGSINQITAARLAAAEEEVRIAQDRVRDAESALDEELKLQEQGYASNVDLKRDQLAEAKALEDQALEERRKAQKQQAAVDALQQSVSLITASAKIFNSLAGLGAIGVGIAIATIATMFAAFAKVKLDAARATKFRQGGQGRVTDSGVIVGPSHSRGGVPIEVEGGEFFGTDGKRFAVVKKHLTGKHFELLDAINRDDGPKIAALAAQLAEQGGISFNPDTGKQFEQVRTERITARQAAELAELKKSNALLKENNDLLKRSLQEKPGTSYFNGGREERTPGLTKIIRTR